MVTIELEPAHGGTMVRLTHSGLPPTQENYVAADGNATLTGCASSDWRRPWSGPLRPLDR
jgi:hypothetical protein